MLERILINICNQMSESLTSEQIDELKNVLYMNFHNKNIVEETTEIIPLEIDPDFMKIKMFAASKKVSGRAESSIQKYIYDIKQFKLAINKPLDTVTAFDVRWYLAFCHENKKNKLSTIEGIRLSLSTFYSYLESEELIVKNPMTKVEPIKLSREIKNAFTSQELEALRSSCKDIRERALIELLYSTGLRVSELCSLNIGDIDLYTQKFTITGKGNKQRIVYISDTAWYHINQYLMDISKKEKCLLCSLKDVPLFVAKKRKERLTDDGVRWILKDIAKRANVNDIHPHRFRRTFATDMINRGMPIEQVMTLMGHSKLDTTMIYYDMKQSTIENTYRRFS